MSEQHFNLFALMARAHVFAQLTFGANAVAVARHQQANHQFGINRWAPDWAIKIGEIMAQIAEIKASINAA